MMEENQTEQPKTYGDESRMYEEQQGYGQNQSGYNQNQPGYNQSQPGYNQQMYGRPPQQPNYSQPYQNGGGQYQVQHGPVTDVFCYLILAIIPIRYILGFFTVGKTFSAMGRSIMDGSYMSQILSGSMLFSFFSNMLTIGLIVFIVLDIVKIYKQGYKITGLILFAIFCKPGYYIWRAYVLGRRKTAPVIYTVATALLLVIYYIFTFYLSFRMAFDLVQMM